MQANIEFSIGNKNVIETFVNNDIDIRIEHTDSSLEDKARIIANDTLVRLEKIRKQLYGNYAASIEQTDNGASLRLQVNEGINATLETDSSGNIIVKIDGTDKIRINLDGGEIIDIG